MASVGGRSTKRKRRSTAVASDTTSPAISRPSPRKRHKRTHRRDDSEDPPAGPDELGLDAADEPFYSARAILKQAGNKYLIDWEDDPVTGEVYEPTWEPRENANKQLVDDWKRRQREERERKKQGPASRRTSAAPAGPHPDSSPAPTPQPTEAPARWRQGPLRLKLIFNSSSGAEPSSEVRAAPASNSAPQDSFVPDTAPESPRRDPAVVITQPTNYHFSDYERFTASQIPFGSSQPEENSSRVHSSNPNAGSSQAADSSQAGRSASNYVTAGRLLSPLRFGDGAIIPDSQSLPGDSSYVPSTQTRSNSGSQRVGTQAQQPVSENTSAQQESSVSATAQFTESQQENSTAPGPESDPIEDASSPAVPDNQEEPLNSFQEESPRQTVSSASSPPPPIETPEKSQTRTQSQSGDNQESLDVQVGSTIPGEQSGSGEGEEQAQLGQRNIALRIQEQEGQAVSEEHQNPVETTPQDNSQASGCHIEAPVCVQDSTDYGAKKQDQPERTGHSTLEGAEDHQVHDHQPNPAEGFNTFARDLDVDRLEFRGIRAEQSAEATLDSGVGSGEPTRSSNRDFLTYPERPAATEQFAETSGEQSVVQDDRAELQQAPSPAQPQGDIRIEHQYHARPVRTATEGVSPRSSWDIAALEDRSHHVLSEPHSSASDQWQAAQYVPDIDLDGPQEGTESVARTQTFSSKSSSHIQDRSSFQASHNPAILAKRKDSSQDSVELGVLSQSDPNVARYPTQKRKAESPGPSPQDIIPSIEGRSEVFRRRKLRRISYGMPQTPQPASSSADANQPATSELSLTEKIRRIRAEGRAERERRKAEYLARSAEPTRKSPSLESSTRSPSTIPPHGPQPTMEPQYTLMPSNLSTQANANGGNASETRQPHGDGDTEMRDGSGPSVLLDEPILGDAEYLIGLSMEGLQGDQYRQMISFKKDVITEFTEHDVSQSPQITNDVQDLLKSVGNVITHMDLGFGDADALTQYDTGAEGMVAWSNNSSTKFRFLGGILDRLRHTKLHFVILGRPGTLIDIIETFVRGMGIQYSRGGNVDRQAFENRGSLFVTILGTNYEDIEQNLPTAQLIFAMDSSFKPESPNIKALRDHLRGSSDSVPIVTPIVTNSLEHVERCISPSIQGLVRLKLVVRFMAELRQLAGRVDGSTKADHAAGLLAPSIETDLDHHEAWPLPRVGSIKDAVRFDESMISSLSVSSSVPVGTMPGSSGQKRHLDVEEQEPAKKLRITPQPEAGTINPNDITRISDSVQASQPLVQSSDPSHDTAAKAYQRDEKLRRELKYTKERLKEFEEALEVCQTEKEEQKEQIFHLKKETTDIKTNHLSMAHRLQTQNNTIDNLRAERDALRKQLEDARSLLESSSVPEIAEREQLRRERDEAIAKLEKAQKARQTESQDSEFFRSQYQDASNRAQELSTENATLTQKVREFEHLASGERERARGLTFAAASDAYREEMEKLAAQLKDREELIRRQSEEIKAIRGRQGVGTRAGSVPRSPRIMGGGPGSRGGSPAPSGLGGRVERLRNLNA